MHHVTKMLEVGTIICTLGLAMHKSILMCLYNYSYMFFYVSHENRARIITHYGISLHASNMLHEKFDEKVASNFAASKVALCMLGFRHRANQLCQHYAQCFERPMLEIMLVQYSH